MPLEDAFAKYGAGRKLLGGSVRTAWGTPEPMMEFIAPDGMIDEQDGFAKGPYLCLEPLPKKREVLVLELPIDEHENVKILDAFGYGSTYAAKDLTSRNSSVIKEVEDAKYGAGRKSHDALLAALKRAVDLLANLADQYPCSCVLCTECCAAIAQDEALKEEGAV
jgi:hypothetical protein